MPKCEYCGKEVLLPFKCPYCGKNFCVEHRLPEKHECSSLPKEAFWYQKQRQKAIKVETQPKKEKIVKEGEFFFVKEKQPKIESEGNKRRLSAKKVVAFSVIVIILVAVLWNSPLIISTIQNYFAQFSYTKVKVLAGVPKDVEIEGNKYVFTYKYRDILFPDLSDDKFYVFVGVTKETYKGFPLIEGEKYEAFGIEIMVSEVHSDYIILLIKPLS